MVVINLEWAKEHETGAFHLLEDGKEQGELAFVVEGKVLRALHTEVNPETQGKGFAGMLFDELVRFARAQQYTVIPVCSYVRHKFKKSPDQFHDLWVQ